MRNSLAFMAALALAAAGLSHAGAQPAKPKDAPAPAATISANAAADLKSNDPTKVRSALDEIRMAGKGSGARFAPQIIELLQKGLTLSLTEAAIDTLGDLETEAGGAAIAPYARHRNVKVRQASVRALAKTKGKLAVTTLRASLSDADAMVRGLSASALGNLKAKEAIGDLFVALDHRVNEAAAAIGQLCTPEECDKLASRLGKFPFDVISNGIDQAIFRADIPEDSKIKLIGQVRELGTADANKFLRDVMKRSTNASPRIKQALDQAVQATGGGT